MSSGKQDPGSTTKPQNRRRFAVALAAAILVAIGAVAAVALVLASTARTAADQASQLEAAITQAKASIERGSLATLPADLQSVRQAATDLATTTETWQWRALGSTPGMAATAQAVTTVSQATTDLADATQPLADAIHDAPSTLALVQRLPELRPAVEQLQAAATTATADLQRIDTTDLKFGLGEQVTQATDQTQAISASTATALDAWPQLEGLLGFDSPRTYLVMLQNPAEARGSGGLFSAFMLLTLTNGSPTIDEAGSRKLLDDTTIPTPSDLDAGEKEMWGDYLTKWASFNTSPDFPTTARLAQAGMAKRGTPVDGVIAIDPMTVQAILAGTGPVEHKGITIDAATAADFFTKGIYEDFPGFTDVDAKDELALGLMYATVDSVLKRPLDLKAFADQLPATISGGHLKAWVPDAAEEDWLESVGAAWAISAADPQATIVALNNATGGKVDAYVSTTVSQQRDICTFVGGDFDGWRRSAITITLENNAPADLPAYVDVRLDGEKSGTGSTRILLTAIGPPVAVVEDTTTNGDYADFVAGQTHGRPYWLAALDLPRGSTQEFTVTFAEPQPTTPAANAIVTGSIAPAAISATDVHGPLPCPPSVG